MGAHKPEVIMKKYPGTVLVAGATGRTGRWIVQRLASYGIDYRLFVRSESKAMELFGAEAAGRLAVGTIEEPCELERAVTGCSAVISAIGAYVTDPEAPPPSVIDRDGMKAFARIGRECGVRHFIQVTSLAVTRPEHPMNRYGGVLNMKLQGEQAIRAAFSGQGASHTILRPGGLQDGEPFGNSLQFGTGDTIMGVINRSDVAECAVISLWHPKAECRTFELVNAAPGIQDSLEPFFDQLP